MAIRMMTQLSRRQIPFGFLSAYRSLSIDDKSKAHTAVTKQYEVFSYLKKGDLSAAKSSEADRSATANLTAAKKVIGDACFESSAVAIPETPTLWSRSTTTLTIKYGAATGATYSGLAAGTFKASVNGGASIDCSAAGAFIVTSSDITSLKIVWTKMYLQRTVTVTYTGTGSAGNQTDMALTLESVVLS